VGRKAEASTSAEFKARVGNGIAVGGEDPWAELSAEFWGSSDDDQQNWKQELVKACGGAVSGRGSQGAGGPRMRRR